MRWKEKNEMEWHRTFAWLPVKVHGRDYTTVVWLESVERKYVRQEHVNGTSRLEWDYRVVI